MRIGVSIWGWLRGRSLWTWGPICCAVLGWGLVATASAAARVRYAAPSGTGPQPCLKSHPCDLVTAATGTGPDGVQDGDQVVVEPGTYTLGSGLNIDRGIDIGGTPGRPLPTLTGSARNLFFLDDGDATAHDLRIITSGPYTAILSFGGTVDRIYAELTFSGTPGGGASACGVYGSKMIDSVCWGKGSGSDGIAEESGGSQSESAVFRNVTAIATAPGNVGLEIDNAEGALTTVTAVNVIARGPLYDVQAMTDSSPGSGATIDLTHSSYATTDVSGTGTSITPSGTNDNQLTTPKLVDEAAGNFRELVGSPTFGAGLTAKANGTLDLAGNPRSYAGKTDIGAYQLEPPAARITASHINLKTGQAKFSFNASGGATSFRCALIRPTDMGEPAFSPCTSPKIYRHLSAGRYKFEVRALGPIGAGPPAINKFKIS